MSIINTRKTLTGLLAVATLGSFHMAFAQPQLSGTPDELRGFLFPQAHTVNISGQGELTAYKDVATVSLRVTTEERDLNQAMAVNQSLRNELIQNFLAAGIAESNINNSKFSSSPQYGLFGRNPNAFEVVARLEVEVNNEAHLQLLASAADEHDAVEFERIEFEHSEEEAFERQVRELALQDVMEQKEYYEASLGLELQAINFYYGGIRQFNRPMAAMQEMAVEDVVVTGSVVRGQAASAASPAIPPTFDEVEYQTNITVVFEIIGEEQ